MLKTICLIVLSVVIVFSSNAQFTRKSKANKNPKALVFADSTSIQHRADSLKQAALAADTVTNPEATIGLKKILDSAALKSTEKLSATNGFLNNPFVKIGIPADDKKSERGLRSLGYNKQVDDAIAAINHAAEDASKTALPILSDAIRNTSFGDAKQLLKASETAGSISLRQSAMNSVISSMRPIVEASIEKNGTSKAWSNAFTSINKFGLNKTSTDLTGYITEKTVSGMFLQMEKEEQAIRNASDMKASRLFQKL